MGNVHVGSIHTNQYNSDQTWVQGRYNRLARLYDMIMAVPEGALWARHRRKLLTLARGDVLEVGVGTGTNLRYYAPTCKLTLVDLSRSMLRRARRRANSFGLQANYAALDAQDLPFADNSFDTVVASLALSSLPDPVRSIQEMARVCRPEGRVLLLETGRSNKKWIGSWQDRKAHRMAKIFGTQWNREPLKLIEEAGLPVVSVKRTFLGIIHRLVLDPTIANGNGNSNGNGKSNGNGNGHGNGHGHA